MSETKNIILTGDVADKLSLRGRRRSRKSLKGGGSTQAGTITQLHSTSSSSDASGAAEAGTGGSLSLAGACLPFDCRVGANVHWHVSSKACELCVLGRFLLQEGQSHELETSWGCLQIPGRRSCLSS